MRALTDTVPEARAVARRTIYLVAQRLGVPSNVLLQPWAAELRQLCSGNVQDMYPAILPLAQLGGLLAGAAFALTNTDADASDAPASPLSVQHVLAAASPWNLYHTAFTHASADMMSCLDLWKGPMSTYSHGCCGVLCYGIDNGQLILAMTVRHLLVLDWWYGCVIRRSQCFVGISYIHATLSGG